MLHLGGRIVAGSCCCCPTAARRRRHVEPAEKESRRAVCWTCAGRCGVIEAVVVVCESAWASLATWVIPAEQEHERSGVFFRPRLTLIIQRRMHRQTGIHSTDTDGLLTPRRHASCTHTIATLDDIPRVARRREQSRAESTSGAASGPSRLRSLRKLGKVALETATTRPPTPNPLRLDRYNTRTTPPVTPLHVRTRPRAAPAHRARSETLHIQADHPQPPTRLPSAARSIPLRTGQLAQN